MAAIAMIAVPCQKQNGAAEDFASPRLVTFDRDFKEYTPS
jgi:hypothetical protein